MPPFALVVLLGGAATLARCFDLFSQGFHSVAGVRACNREQSVQATHQHQPDRLTASTQKIASTAAARHNLQTPCVVMQAPWQGPRTRESA